MTNPVSLGKIMEVEYPGIILSMQPLPLCLDARQGLQAWPVPLPPPPAAQREQSQTSLSPEESDANRSVGLTKDPVSWGRGVTLG